jgi:hypothetical protein
MSATKPQSRMRSVRSLHRRGETGRVLGLVGSPSFYKTTMQQIKISNGNIKLGGIPNLNLPPGPQYSCRKTDCKCYEDCYARKAWRQYPAVRTAWTSNWDLWNDDPQRFISDLTNYLKKKKPEYFRWHSSGDIPDQSYADMIMDVAEYFPDTRFLVFTKNYGVLMDQVPDNLSVVYSRWPGIPFPSELMAQPQAHYTDGDITTALKGTKSTQCPGSCSECKLCWNLHDGEAVMFHKH